ncbi:MAG: HAMP domain-containing sensor histidine kinase [Solirubrobacteraceae bacterium]
MNVLLVLATVAVTFAVLAPGKMSSVAVDEEVAVLLAAIAAVVAGNVFVLRRVVGPVQALTAMARRVDLTTPERMPIQDPRSEAGVLAATFNDMLERLTAERREATRRALAAQEAERLRIARELHDQVGQELTAVLLGLARVQSHSSDRLQGEIAAVQDVVRASLEDVRRIAIELRPEALDDLGLPSALAVLAERFSERIGVRVSLAIAPDLPGLTSAAELVIYRVAQEALTNVARHSGADRAEISLYQKGDWLKLVIRDRGRGLPAKHAPGTGMQGMRERATLIGAKLAISNLAPTGCEVRLEVSLGDLR